MYLVIEIQKSHGSASSLTFSFNNIKEAEAKYHSVLSAAALSNLECHSCVLMTDEGFCIKRECYKYEEE